MTEDRKPMAALRRALDASEDRFAAIRAAAKAAAASGAERGAAAMTVARRRAAAGAAAATRSLASAPGAAASVVRQGAGAARAGLARQLRLLADRADGARASAEDAPSKALAAPAATPMLSSPTQAPRESAQLTAGTPLVGVGGRRDPAFPEAASRQLQMTQSQPLAAEAEAGRAAPPPLPADGGGRPAETTQTAAADKAKAAQPANGTEPTNGADPAEVSEPAEAAAPTMPAPQANGARPAKRAVKSKAAEPAPAADKDAAAAPAAQAADTRPTPEASAAAPNGRRRLGFRDRAGADAAKEPAAKAPMAKEPVAQQPVGQAAAAEEPVAKQPVSQEPLSQEPLSEEPAATQPAAKAQAVAKPAPEGAAGGGEERGPERAEAPATDPAKRAAQSPAQSPAQYPVTEPAETAADQPAAQAVTPKVPAPVEATSAKAARRAAAQQRFDPRNSPKRRTLPRTMGPGIASAPAAAATTEPAAAVSDVNAAEQTVAAEAEGAAITPAATEQAPSAEQATPAEQASAADQASAGAPASSAERAADAEPGAPAAAAPVEGSADAGFVFDTDGEPDATAAAQSSSGDAAAGGEQAPAAEAAPTEKAEASPDGAFGGAAPAGGAGAAGAASGASASGGGAGSGGGDGGSAAGPDPRRVAQRVFGPGSDDFRGIFARAVGEARASLVAVGIFSFVINLLILAIPIYLFQVSDNVLTSRSLDTLVMLTVVVIGALAVHSILDVARRHLLMRIATRFETSVGAAVVGAAAKSAQHGSQREFAAVSDLGQIRNFMTGPTLISMFDAPVAPVYFLAVYLIHPQLGMIVTVAAMLLVVIALINQRITAVPFARANALNARAMFQVEAMARNGETVNAMGMIPEGVVLWGRDMSEALKAQVIAQDRNVIMAGVSKFVRLSTQIAMLCWGAYLALGGELTGGMMIAASIISSRALAPVEGLIEGWRSFVQARGAFARVQGLLSSSPLNLQRLTLPRPQGRLQVERVLFVPPPSKKVVLNSISFQLEPGEVMAIVGPSGTGKSTLAKMLVGSILPTSGAVRLDMMDIRNWEPRQLGETIGYLPQEVQLFPASIKANIARLREDATDAAIYEAAELAGVHEMISGLSQGYETLVGLDGSPLSGGQKQRIGLARAFFGNPRLVILDEPNSNLDTAGEAALAQALDNARSRGITVVAVTQRPSLLRSVDKIMVLNEGRVQALGPRDEVLPALRNQNLSAKPDPRITAAE